MYYVHYYVHYLLANNFFTKCQTGKGVTVFLCSSNIALELTDKSLSPADFRYVIMF